MSTTEHHKGHTKEYVIVFFALGILTLIEIFVPSVKTLTKFMKGSILTFLAVGKAALVAYFYMHLKEETRWLKFVALIPTAAVLYTVVAVLEALYR